MRGADRSAAPIVVTTPVIVGRAADVTIADPAVSRHHARVAVDGGELVVHDLGSANGTWVNGRRVERAVLQPGDVVTMGSTTIDVVAADHAEGRSPPARTTLRLQPGEGRVAEQEQLRPVTALFADVVGSTGLGERLAPDEVSVVIGECVSRISAVVERFGGVVGAYLGDGLGAFFGLHTASEHDPELAAHAALEILSSVAKYAAELETTWGITDFAVRIGVNSGDAAVGSIRASQKAEVALGDATNVAARLQGLAEPGTVVVGEETAGRLRGRFVLEPLGEISVKGRAAPVAAWQLLGPLDRPRLPPRRELVGRDTELELVRSLADRLLAGEGGSVFVVGELGTGKTSLLAELESRAGAHATVLQAFCAASPASPPYSPIPSMLRAWLGVDSGAEAQIVGPRLTARLASLGCLDLRTTAGLASLLALDLEYDPEDAQPVEACVTWLAAAARARPLVVALDDIHLLEPSGAAVVSALVELATTAPLLVVSTLRPEHDSRGWQLRTTASVGSARVTEVTLGPLSDDAIRDCVLRAAPSVDAATLEEIVRLAEGIPLFAEQLLRASAERGTFPVAPGSLRTVATARLLPPTLQSVFVGRIDRLPPYARALAQVAASIGRTFRRSLLERLVGAPAVDAALPALLDAGIVVELDPPPAQAWSFSHALLRDAVLSTLVRSRRRQIFSDVAAAFEASVADAEEEHLELLAYYYARSDRPQKAVVYHERAAARAVRLGADSEAAEWLTRAVEIAAHAGDEAAVRRLTSRLAVTSGPRRLDVGPLSSSGADAVPNAPE